MNQISTTNFLSNFEPLYGGEKINMTPRHERDDKTTSLVDDAPVTYLAT